jgi:hypothetical protein
MTIDNIFEFRCCDGYTGGIVIANNLKEAEEKVNEYICRHMDYLDKNDKKIIIWNIRDDQSNDSDVYMIFDE